MAAAQRVFGTVELLEATLLHLDIRTLLLSQRVSRQFNAVINGSKKLRQVLYFERGADFPRVDVSYDCYHRFCWAQHGWKYGGPCAINPLLEIKADSEFHMTWPPKENPVVKVTAEPKDPKEPLDTARFVCRSPQQPGCSFAQMIWEDRMRATQPSHFADYAGSPRSAVSLELQYHYDASPGAHMSEDFSTGAFWERMYICDAELPVEWFSWKRGESRGPLGPVYVGARSAEPLTIGDLLRLEGTWIDRD